MDNTAYRLLVRWPQILEKTTLFKTKTKLAQHNGIFSTAKKIRQFQ